MDRNNEHDERILNDGTDSVMSLTEQMGKIWWPDANHNVMDNRRSARTPLGNDGDHDNNRINRAKYIASLSVKSSMERIWAKELFEIDAREREAIVNEIHGVKSSRMIDETPELILTRVESLRHYIQQNFEASISRGEIKEAYKRVVVVGNRVPYINDEKCLLKFLRCSYFDIDKAGQRYFLYLELIYELFHDVAFERPLMLKDLTEREMRYLKKGQIQLLPCRDRSGRRILIYSGRIERNFNAWERFRALMYLTSVASEDETTQKLGLVVVASPKKEPGANPFGENGMALLIEKLEILGGDSERDFYHKFVASKPVRTSAIHFIGPDTFIYYVAKSFILFILRKEERKIVRFHNGSLIECYYSVKSFGIPPNELPFTEDGHTKNKRIPKFFAARNAIDAMRLKQHQEKSEKRKEDGSVSIPVSPSSVAFECPDIDCVIFGNRARYNAANLDFRNILKVMDREREDMQARGASVPPVKEFINSIIQIAQSPEHNLRFVAIDKKTSLFVEIKDHQELYNTVSQSLRDERKRTRLENRLHEAANQHNDMEERSQNDGRYSSDGDGSASTIGLNTAELKNIGSNSCCEID